VIAIDTSVAVAAFASWHEDHKLALTAMQTGPRLIAHVAQETYSVLTRLPPPHRAPADVAVEYLQRNFGDPVLALPASKYGELLSECVAAGVLGGTVYDAFIAATARHAGATLVTLDRRAIPTYESIGANVRFLS
jgi:predicted nucleic acid-binding protein